ncbi:MAG TPA: peptide deformylase [Alphaproteobacteria bacterium]|nr:peptide deformylase [Alphaproteobacteria bacterium]
MALLDILVAPDPRLARMAEPVPEVDRAVRKLMDDMLETMYAAPGIGLAAPQVGVNKRVLVIDIAKDPEKPEPLRIANPEIVWKSDEVAMYEEGCLSLPEQFAEVERPIKVVARYLDENNVSREIEADGLLATCLQHEIDHLQGVLFVDHISTLKRGMILRKLQKLKKTKGEPPAKRAAGVRL